MSEQGLPQDDSDLPTSQLTSRYLDYEMTQMSPESAPTFTPGKGQQFTVPGPAEEPDAEGTAPDDTVMAGNAMPGEEPMPGDPDMDAEQRLRDIEEEIEQIKQNQWLPPVLPPMFFANLVGSSGFQEQIFNNGQWNDFVRGGGSATCSPLSDGTVNPVLMFGLEDPTSGSINYRYLGGSTIAIQITSDYAAGTYWGRYKAKTYTAGTASATSPGTLNATENVIFFNGAEWGLATSNNLLVSPNTTSFGVGPIAATVIGTVTIGGVVYTLATDWVGFVACTSGSVAESTPAGVVVSAGSAMYVPYSFEITSGQTLEIGSGAVLEIG